MKTVKVAVSMGSDLVGTEGQGGTTIIMVLNSARIPPLEELQHQKCSALRGELDSPTPRVFGGFWSQVCLG